MSEERIWFYTMGALEKCRLPLYDAIELVRAEVELNKGSDLSTATLHDLLEIIDNVNVLMDEIGALVENGREADKAN